VACSGHRHALRAQLGLAAAGACRHPRCAHVGGADGVHPRGVRRVLVAPRDCPQRTRGAHRSAGRPMSRARGREAARGDEGGFAAPGRLIVERASRGPGSHRRGSRRSVMSAGSAWRTRCRPGTAFLAVDGGDDRGDVLGGDAAMRAALVRPKISTTRTQPARNGQRAARSDPFSSGAIAMGTFRQPVPMAGQVRADRRR
jgi:hypothetical protein